MKKLLKPLFAFVLIAMFAVSMVFANNTPVKAQPANVYTYYLDTNCDEPVYCSTEITEGVLCSEQFQGLTVYSAPGCQGGNEVTTILGKKQP